MHVEPDRSQFLRFARRVLELSTELEEVNPASLALDPAESFSILQNDPAGCFVTLRNGDRLRGCVGTLAPAATLLETVGLCALNAAYSDPRFPPLTREELGRISIEISLLSPLARAAGPESIIPGTHGVYLRRAGRSGLFLPQVWRQIPEREGFLSELCFSKAGLDPGAWRDPETEIFCFTVEIIEES